jgi:uridylate kinase
MSPQKETVIISVGGSLIVPDKISTSFLKKFRALLLEEVENGKQFVIIAGGGKTARNYQHAADALTTLTNEDIDWLGIHATRLNAHLLRAIFHEYAHPVVIKSPDKTPARSRKKILIAAGWKPGWSTDYVAVKIAEQLNAKKMVNLSNIDYAYDKDPKKYKDAQAIKESSWKDFRALLPKEWDPGLSAPFDPIASKYAQKLGMEVALINGSKLQELKKYLNKESFTGTIIH